MWAKFNNAFNVSEIYLYVYAFIVTNFSKFKLLGLRRFTLDIPHGA